MIAERKLSTKNKFLRNTKRRERTGGRGEVAYLANVRRGCRAAGESVAGEVEKNTNVRLSHVSVQKEQGKPGEGKVDSYCSTKEEAGLVWMALASGDGKREGKNVQERGEKEYGRIQPLNFRPDNQEKKGSTDPAQIRQKSKKRRVQARKQVSFTVLSERGVRQGGRKERDKENRALLLQKGFYGLLQKIRSIELGEMQGKLWKWIC